MKYVLNSVLIVLVLLFVGNNVAQANPVNSDVTISFDQGYAPPEADAVIPDNKTIMKVTNNNNLLPQTSVNSEYTTQLAGFILIIISMQLIKIKYNP